jgi:Rab GDP dissociation inhibitor
VHTTSARKLCEKYNLSESTVDFVGHTMALFTNDEYLDQPSYTFIKKVKLYVNSLASYGKSPFLYPQYGLGDLPGSFSRMGAVYGSITIPNRRIDRIIYDEKGRVCGVESHGEVVKCQNVIAHPSYVPSEKVQPAGQVIRAICILEHPIPNTNNSDSCQIIIPQKQTGRKSDIYITCVSFTNNVAPAGKYIAMVSTTVETKDPNKELEPGLQLLGPILKQFVSISDLWVPVNDWERERVFISKSYDATSHFETVCDDILRIYRQYTGHYFDFSKQPNASLESNTNQ